MKNLSLLVLLCSILSFTNVSAFKDKPKADAHIATCTGSRNCYACKNCKYCAHCNAGGGSCGICTSTSKSINTLLPESLQKPITPQVHDARAPLKKGRGVKEW